MVAATDFELEDEAFASKSVSGVRPATPAARVDGDDGRGAEPEAEPATDAQPPRNLAQLADPAERAHAYAGRSKSDATIRAYAAGWRDFLSFCEERDVSPLPASDQTVAAYLATRSPCTGSMQFPHRTHSSRFEVMSSFESSTG